VPAGAKIAAAVPVTVATVKSGDLDDYLNAIGTVTPLNTVTVVSRVSGQIMQVYFKEGQNVQKGQLLVQIDPRPYDVQYQQALGTLEHDTATLRNDILNLARDRELFKQNVIAAETLDTQQAAVAQDRGLLVTDKANVDNAKLQLTYSRVTAPLTGRIGLRMVDPGNIIQANSTQGIAVITQLQPISVVVSISEDNLEDVLAAMKLHDLPALAYDREFKKQLASGSLMALDNEIDTTTGTLKLKAIFPNENELLYPDQFVNVKLLVQTLHDQLLVPQVAIQRSAQGTFVYVVGANQTVDVHAVKLGYSQADIVAVTSGLNVGDVVVTDGVDRLQQGSLVAIRSPSTNAPTSSPVAVNSHQ
jgi:multidrug efflux system membrane fusion protein